MSKLQTFCLPLAGLFALAVPATAEEGIEEATDQSRLEEVVVIGSRARIEIEANQLPVPVDLYRDTDLERVGEVDLAAALTKLAPSLNYSRTSLGDGGSFNPATLRGLSPDQTLVLVNGKRRHTMAWLRVLDGVIGWGSGGTDLRAIPSAALARVEVLRDGAAAQYGSDAIAGVINLVLRETTGGQITAYATGAGDGGGVRRNLAFNGGVSIGAGGFLNVTVEWHDEEALERNGGNGGLDPNFQDELIADSSPRHDLTSLFFNAGIPFGDTGEAYAFGGLSNRQASSSGAYRFRHNYWEGLQSGDDTWDFVVPNFINFHERNTHPVYPNGFLPYEESDIEDFSIAGGVRSNVADWDVDVSLTYGTNEFAFSASNTINASIGAQYLADNPGAGIASIIANAGPLGGSSGSIEFNQLSFNVDVQRELTGAVRAVAAGFEHRAESYRQNAGEVASWSCGQPHVSDYGAFAVGPDGTPLDGVVAACGFQGYPGYSPTNAELSDDDRSSQSAYLEVYLQSIGNLEIAAALRFENYSDAGGNTTGKVTARLPINDSLSIRGAASTGFRAPSLSQRRFNSILFVGSETGLTTVFSANEGHAVARAFGVDSLDHETSANLSGGIVYAKGDFDLTVDAYSTDIDDRIVRSKGIGCSGIAACDSANVGTAALFLNGVDTETTGVDVRARWRMDVADGILWLSANAHSNETEITGRRRPAGAPANLTFDDYYGGWAAQLLVEGQPRRQANITAEWERGNLGTHGHWGLLGRVNYYGETTQNPVDTGTVTVESASTMDLEVRWPLLWTRDAGTVDISLGINNVFDELPTELAKTHLANILWGVRYPIDTPYGIAGRFAYLRLSYEFGR